MILGKRRMTKGKPPPIMGTVGSRARDVSARRWSGYCIEPKGCEAQDQGSRREPVRDRLDLTFLLGITLASFIRRFAGSEVEIG
jgi:hypothetical protein